MALIILFAECEALEPRATGHSHETFRSKTLQHHTFVVTDLQQCWMAVKGRKISD